MRKSSITISRFIARGFGYVGTRNITKNEFKKSYSLYRKNDRASLVGTDLFPLCSFVFHDGLQVDPLLIKSVSLAINIEYSQLLDEAA